jgi:hypothetical protein
MWSIVNSREEWAGSALYKPAGIVLCASMVLMVDSCLFVGYT